jgi:succinoglycan biosynthesis transport protein ExoP
VNFFLGQEGNFEMDFRTGLMATYKKLWLIIVVPLLVGLATYYSLQLSDKKYKSAATLATGFASTSQRSASGAVTPQDPNIDFNNLLEMMKTELIGSMVSYQLLLYDLTEETPFRPNHYTTIFTIERSSAKKRLKDRLDSFELIMPRNALDNRIQDELERKGYDIAEWISSGDLEIKRIEDTDFLKIEFTSENPFLSAFVVNTLCEEYIRYNALSTTASPDSTEFFTSELEARKKELDDLDAKMNSTPVTSAVGSNHEYERRQLENVRHQLSEAEDRANTLLSSLSEVRSSIRKNETAAQQPASDQETRQVKLAELQKKINELTDIYVKTEMKDKKLAQTVDNLKEQFRKIDSEESVVKTNESEINELKTRERTLESEYTRTADNISVLRRKVASLREEIPQVSKNEFPGSLKEQRDSAAREYAVAYERLNRLNKEKSNKPADDSNLRLAVQGQPSAVPVRSGVGKIVTIAVIISALLCTIVVIILAYTKANRQATEPALMISR